jgi:endothelin-converting enzyme
MATCLSTLIRTFVVSTFLYQVCSSLPLDYEENTIDSDPNILARDETSSANKNEKTCVTKECMKISASIKAAINEEVKPCDDFYDYACGQWMKDNKIPKGKLQISAFTELRDKNNEIMREALVKDDELNNLLPIKKVRTFFQSCLNVNAIDKLGNEPITKYIKELNSWAVDKRTGWNEDKWDVFETLKKIQKHYTSSNLFFTVESVPDPTRKGTQGENILMVKDLHWTERTL